MGETEEDLRCSYFLFWANSEWTHYTCPHEKRGKDEEEWEDENSQLPKELFPQLNAKS